MTAPAPTAVGIPIIFASIGGVDSKPGSGRDTISIRLGFVSVKTDVKRDTQLKSKKEQSPFKEAYPTDACHVMDFGVVTDGGPEGAIAAAPARLREELMASRNSPLP